MIDVRLESELSGPVGYIPGVNWFPRTDVDKIMQSFRKDELIAVICTNDTDSRDVVRTLRANGYLYAAIMAGGMRTWRLMGYVLAVTISVLYLVTFLLYYISNQ